MSLSEVISGECATRPQEMSDAAAVGLYPLSFAQQRLWFLDQLQPGNPAYNIPMAWRLEGPLDIPALQRSLGELVRRHEVLRTRFAAVDGQPFQLVTPAAPFELPFRDLSAEPDPEAKARRLIQDAARQPFDLQRGPLFRAQLFRLREHEHIAFFSLHHLVADGWSFEILRREVGVFYAAFCAGTEPNLPELPIQYLDYAHWQREQWRGQALQMELEFWKQRLAGELPALELPGDLPRTGLKSYEGRSAPFELTAELAGALRELGSREGATLFMLLLAAFSAFIHRLTGADEFVIGAPVSDRSRTETEGLIGLFVHTVALRMDLRGDPTFCDLLARARDTTLGALAHQEIPFEEVVKALQPERALDRNPLFQVVLALQAGFLRQWKWGDLRATLLEVETGTAKFDWTFLLEETDWGVKGRLEYNTDLFEAGLIESFLQHFQSLLQGIVAEPGRRISELPLMTPVERTGLLADMNQTATDYERDAGIHEVFEAQVKRTPDAVALVFGDEQWTYDELNRRANQLAHRLQLAGVEPEVRVGLAMERSLEMLVAMLAILKAGGAYVPLDRSYPRQRLAFMLQDADVSVLVTDARSEVEPFQTARREKPLTVIRLDAAVDNSDPASPENLRSGATAENLAYVIYTSGSTGTPKGAAIPHRAVVRLVRHTNYVRFLPNDVFLQLAPISFDASTFEIWGCLLNGGRLVIFPPHLPSLEELGRTIQQHQVTTLWLTAGMFHQMVDHQLDSLKSVRQLLAGGDVLSVPHVLKALRGLPGCQLINGYGPTENTTFTCCYRVPADWSGGNSVPIGKPISNTHVYVLDENLSLVPTGVPGELCVGGDGLARGYLNRPELTAETFIPNPFAADTPRAEARLYRTGDRVRLRQDGHLEFLGRSDQQVKIRGFRVELGEIEAALAQHPSVREAVVLARPGSSDDRQLVAYIVSPPAGPAGGELRTFLADKLPAHMLPAHFVALDQLPLTANGKVDRRALPALEETVMHLVVEPTGSPPRNPVEATLLEIWRGLLGRGSFGIHENFFYLGGHSLLVTRMISRILKEFQIELPVRAVFEAPTVAALAERISTTPHTAIHGPAVPNRRRQRAQARQLLARLDELSEAEIESLLEVPHRKSVVS